ncbi:MAG: SpoVK/Ycf46/Vps4 family AAA+-type ATPase [Candidatus Endobugula sp.]|jgi:SpoVK/Ycf46/Vps4 family AAA+-type ATPase
MEDLNDIELMVKKGSSLIAIESYEEPRVLELCTRLAIKTCRPLYSWSCTAGLQNGLLSQSATESDVNQATLTKPAELLASIRQKNAAGIYVLCDFHVYFEEPDVVRSLKDIALYSDNQVTLMLLSHALTLPPEIHRYSTRFQLSFPSENKIRQIVLNEVRQWQQQHIGRRVNVDAKTLSLLTNNLRGLTESDVKRLVHGAIVDDGAITISDVDDVNRSKFELMNMNNILTFEYDTAQFAQVGGLKKLKQWLDERQSTFSGISKDKSDTRPALDTPKGILLLGVQGGGKSLAAKAIAGLWNVPLLRLDMGALYNKFHGETERNLRETLQLADNVSPCVLWMDEIEKSLGQSDNEGISQRVLGTLLTWMAERKSRVFIVATSNDISRLPPELLRKGRLDEIFFVDLPNATDRAVIAQIHLRLRHVDFEKEQVIAIAESTQGFTGAEIEQVIVSALYSAKAQQKTLTVEHVLNAVDATVPISVVRSEDIQALRHWAKERAVMAN